MHGVVAAGNPYTAAAAAEVLREGGNAIDAVVAGALASFVSEPLLASAGGSGMLVAAFDDGRRAVVDFFGEAPGRGKRPDRLDFDAIEVDFGEARQVFHVGRAAAAVPLALPGLAKALRHFGRLPLRKVVRPAMTMARDGVALTAESCHVTELLMPVLRRDPATLALFAPGDRAPTPGTTHRNETLARLLHDYGEGDGLAPALYDGMLEEFGSERGGLLCEDDLREAEVQIVQPRTTSLSNTELLLSPRIGGHLVGLIAEALQATAAEHRAAHEVLRIARASQEGHRARGRTHLGSTTHLSVMDSEGAAAGATLTNGEGSGHLVRATGVQMNNFLGEEDLNPEGFHKKAPGTPLPTMIAPTIALRDGRPMLTLGSGGSNRIRSVVAQVLYRVIVLGEDLEAAVLASRVHAEDDDVWVELEGIADREATLRELISHFQRVHPFDRRAFFFGGVHSVMKHQGTLLGSADPRRGGAALYV